MALKPNFDAVIFDLDGVITQTALVHGSAWKKMFDNYLQSREERFNEPFKEFTHAGDYLPYVDGKPRYKGVASFLESRGIDIPFGDPSDPPGKETVCGLGNSKNDMFNEVLDEEGVKMYDTSVALIHELLEAGVRIGVASSSKNCGPVLEKAGLLHLFETRIDGVVSAEIGLQGKPEPDIFTTACDRLGVEYHRSVVVEDAVSGVQAGRNGNFGFVIGVAREENISELLVGGGDIVVEDLGEVSIESINSWFEKGMEEDGWSLKYFDYDQASERSREALLAVGNGYCGTRGAMEESCANKVNYPGTYISGLFNRLTSKVADRDIENEDFVNITNWLPVTFRINGGSWFSFDPEPAFKIITVERRLDFKTGELSRKMVVEDDEGRQTRVVSSRFAGMHDPHNAGLRYALTPANYTGTIELKSELSGDHKNAGVERYNDLNQQHLEPVMEEVAEAHVLLEMRTTTSGIKISVAGRTKASVATGNSLDEEIESGPGRISQLYSADLDEGQEMVLEKLVSIHTSQDPEEGDASDRARTAVSEMKYYNEELGKSAEAWSGIWDKIDIKIAGDRAAQKLVRMHLYHMLVSASPHHAKLDAGIAPRGLHGEAYRGHIFWDELYILPLYNIHFPEVTKSTLMYRHKRLDEARKYAKEYGYEGAMFPWQSGSEGREETQVIHLNPLSGEWGDDYSSLQRHISLALVFNTWNYYRATNNNEFMEGPGAELFLDICKFWASKCKFSTKDNRYHIDKVMGPDEFHEKLPGSSEGGLSDNAYTNIMVSWLMDRALKLLDAMDPGKRTEVLTLLNLKEENLESWSKIKSGLALNISNEGIIEQFSGYFDLQELDWDYFRKKYGNIHRLDRILKSEGKSPDDYKLSKQADLLMLFYNLGEARVTRIIKDLGYAVPDDYLIRNFNYYIERTSHGSTLSRLVHGRLAWEHGMQEIGWELFMDALKSDLVDIQGGTTGEGIHCGVMAGTVYEVISTFAGIDLRGTKPVMNPALPGHWKGLEFSFNFREKTFNLLIQEKELKIVANSTGEKEIIADICGDEMKLLSGKPKIIKLH